MGDPVCQFNEFRRKSRKNIEHARDFPNLCVFRSVFGEFHDNADKRLRAKSHKDATAGLYSAAHGLRHGVGESRSQRQGQGHVAQGTIHRAK